MKYLALLSNANNSSIVGKGMGANVSFLVPVTRGTESNKEFSFL